MAPSLLPVKTYVNYDTWGHGPSKVPGELSVLEMQQQIMSSWILKLGRAVLSSPTWEQNLWVGLGFLGLTKDGWTLSFQGWSAVIGGFKT